MKKYLLFIFLICASSKMWGQSIPLDEIVPWKFFENEAIKGDDFSQYFVGKNYLEGSDVYFANVSAKLDTTIQIDYEKAFYWFQKSAEQGFAGAEFELGNCYAFGLGVSENNELAFVWYQRAAKQGYSIAQANLGVIYKGGYGVEKNGDTALYWLEMAAKNKDKTLGDNESAITQLIEDLKAEGYSSNKIEDESDIVEGEEEKMSYGSPRVALELKNNQMFLVTEFSTDETYGYTEKNPIMVGGGIDGPVNEKRFLNTLAGPKGEKISYQRIGSCCQFYTQNGVFDDVGLLDVYEIKYKGNKTPIILYINMYDSDVLKVPVGFTLKK